jgi:p-aminobenzoyl-glutamate transporter AbgT
MERILFMAVVTLICLIIAWLTDKPLNKAIKKYEEDKRNV